ncbi:MAG: OB-fold nucleic acid binding domain-containing protein [Candidatus Nanopelagicales bacterium]|jgi:RecG-like helicase
MAPSTARTGEHRGLWNKLTRSKAEVEADELQSELAGEQRADTGLEAICNCAPGQEVAVRGMVRAITVRPQGSVPALEIDLYDGSGSVTVVWLGRRGIPGIEPGRSMVVHGRLTCNEDSPTIYNPRYELKPTAG